MPITNAWHSLCAALSTILESGLCELAHSMIFHFDIYIYSSRLLFFTLYESFIKILISFEENKEEGRTLTYICQAQKLLTLHDLVLSKTMILGHLLSTWLATSAINLYQLSFIVCHQTLYILIKKIILSISFQI